MTNVTLSHCIPQLAPDRRITNLSDIDALMANSIPLEKS